MPNEPVKNGVLGMADLPPRFNPHSFMEFLL